MPHKKIKLKNFEKLVPLSMGTFLSQNVSLVSCQTCTTLLPIPPMSVTWKSP